MVSFKDRFLRLFKKKKPKEPKNGIKKKRIPSWIQVFIDCTTSFFDYTTIHGLRHIVTPERHVVEKIFWLLMVILVSMFAGQLGYGQLMRFLLNPTVVSIKKDFREWTTNFPAITLCLTDRIDAEAADRFIERTWNVNASNEEQFEYYRSYVRLVASVSFRSNLRLFWKFEKDPTLEGIQLMHVAASVTPQIVIRSSFHIRNHRVVWEPVMTEMGLCRTFNSVFSRYQSVKTWSLQLTNMSAFSSDTNADQLLKCNYMARQCYARFTMLNATGKYYVHSPYELAETNSNPTGIVGEGEELDAQYRCLQITAADDVRPLTPAQRHCKYPDEPISKTIPAYSNSMCQIDCRGRMAMVFCGCRPFFYVTGDGVPCDTRGMACIGRNMEILVNLPTNLAKCQCVPQCTEINYISHDQKITQWNASKESLFDRQSSVKFALQMPKVLMSKDVIFSFEDLVASFGGVGALFLGISFVSFIEILICFCRPCKHIIMPLTKKLCGSRRIQHSGAFKTT